MSTANTPPPPTPTPTLAISDASAAQDYLSLVATLNLDVDRLQRGLRSRHPNLDNVRRQGGAIQRAAHNYLTLTVTIAWPTDTISTEHQVEATMQTAVTLGVNLSKVTDLAQASALLADYARTDQAAAPERMRQLLGLPAPPDRNHF